MSGYIYVRTHPSYNNACKMGKTTSIPDRDSQYITNELIRGKFEIVIEVIKEELGNIEELLQEEFKELNIRYDAGTEFYNKKIMPYIEPCLKHRNIQFKRLTEEEINSLSRREKQYQNKIIPRDYQKSIIEKSIKYFEKNDRGLLTLPCGIGKTLISLWIAQGLNAKTILIGVPNKLLLNQWYNTVKMIMVNVPCMLISEGSKSENIIEFIEKNKDNYIIITTYASAYKLITYNLKYDIKIIDEAHHLTTNSMKFAINTKKYVQILNIPCKKQLGLTATTKLIENSDNNKDIVSNNSNQYFGEIIEKRNILWAINEKIICDYIIQTIIIDDKDLVKNNLHLSAYSALKSINDKNSHHLLIYANNINNLYKIVKYIKRMLKEEYFNIPQLYYSSYHGAMSLSKQKRILQKFEESKYGIICCVYCLGEGWDFPLLDGVVFAENMSSNIRIVQSVLRASRKDVKNPDKITKIILPVINRYNWLDNNDNSDFKKVREVIYQMSLEDETISEKIKVYNYNGKNKLIISNNKLSENNTLTEQLKLRTIYRESLGITYEKAVKLLANMKLKNKEEYYKLCENDYRFTKEPETVYKGNFTNWIDYLSIERIYYNKFICMKKIQEFINQNSQYKTELSTVISILCKNDKLFPPIDLWTDYYGINSINELFKNISIYKKKMV